MAAEPVTDAGAKLGGIQNKAATAAYMLAKGGSGAGAASKAEPTTNKKFKQIDGTTTKVREKIAGQIHLLSGSVGSVMCTTYGHPGRVTESIPRERLLCCHKRSG